MKGNVYLLKIISDDKYYKIGITKNNVISRVKQLQTGNSETIEIESEYRTDNYLKVEKMLHNKFDTRNIRGEWFQLKQEHVDGFKEYCMLFDKTISILKSSGNPFI